MDGVKVFELPALLGNRKAFDDEGWQQFLDCASLRSGLYVLPPGGEDKQSPHRQDEVYYVLRGEGQLVCECGENEKTLPVREGSVVFVERNTPHRFEDFSQGLTLLVFFSKSEEVGL